MTFEATGYGMALCLAVIFFGGLGPCVLNLLGLLSDATAVWWSVRGLIFGVFGFGCLVFVFLFVPVPRRK